MASAAGVPVVDKRAAWSESVSYSDAEGRSRGRLLRLRFAAGQVRSGILLGQNLGPWESQGSLCCLRAPSLEI